MHTQVSLGHHRKRQHCNLDLNIFLKDIIQISEALFNLFYIIINKLELKNN